MFDPKITQSDLSALISAMSADDFSRFLYCQHIASTHLAIGQFEDMLISAMLMCDRVRLEKTLGADISGWERIARKQKILHESTVGSLIQILARHNVAVADLAYLKWIKDKRDYFVHRLLQRGAWPGDLDIEGCHKMTRKLMAIQLWMERSKRQIWLIFERAGFVELDFFADGILASNPDIGEYL